MATAVKLGLLLLLSVLALRTRAEAEEVKGSVVFFDSPDQRFIRGSSGPAEGEGKALSTNEVAATISVLLGSAPGLVSPDSSLKINEVLVPNPFNRPRAVFMLEVTGVKNSLPSFAYSSDKVGGTFSSSVLSSSKADIELSGEDGVSRLDKPSSTDCDAACITRELAYLGGTHDGNELKFHLGSSSAFSLNLAKESARNFALQLVSLSRNVKAAAEDREVLQESNLSPAELLIGRFTGIEALEKEYGSEDNVQQGLEVLQAAVTKLFELLQRSYGGKIVAVVLFSMESSANSNPMLNINFPSHEARLLAEASQLKVTKIDEVILVRWILAWATGIILLVSTLIGTCYLLNMPLTRDTLLYSNVKLD